MAKDPAFLFYPNDWLGGTLGMTLEEKGAYMELLMMQFNRGHMTCHMIGQVVGQIWVKLEVKFKKDENGLYYNERLEQEIEKRKAYVRSRFNNKEGKNQYTNKRGHMTTHMTGHMENEDEDINNNNKGVQKRKKFIPPTLEEVKNFFEEKGYSEIGAIKAFNHYDLAGWHDTNGKPVLNWKQKMNTVWLKDEYKLQNNVIVRFNSGPDR